MTQIVLKNVIQSEELADLVATSYDGKTIARTLVLERAGDITMTLRDILSGYNSIVETE